LAINFLLRFTFASPVLRAYHLNILLINNLLNFSVLSSFADISKKDTLYNKEH